MSAYLAAVLGDAPLHYWRLADPGGGAAIDIGSARENVYTAGGAPQLGYSGPVSDGGSCFFLGNAWFKSAQTPTRSPPYTLECWVWQAATPTNDVWAFSCNNAKIGDANGTAYAIATVTAFALASTTAVPAGSWHHLVLTVTTTVMTIWLDGVIVATASHATGAQTAADFIGSDGTNAMQGFVAECAFYAFVLGNARIAAHFAAPDQLTLAPTYKIGGTFNPVTGVFQSTTDLLTSLLSWVARDLRNTP